MAPHLDRCMGYHANLDLSLKNKKNKHMYTRTTVDTYGQGQKDRNVCWDTKVKTMIIIIFNTMLFNSIFQESTNW